VALKFGVLRSEDLRLPHAEFIDCLRSNIATFSYDLRHPPDFQSHFEFVIGHFSDCDDLDLLKDAIELLGHIAGYKLGVSVIHIFTAAAPMALRLLESPAISHTKSSVDYYRKISRAIGPRLVLSSFVAPNSPNRAHQRGLAVIAHQCISDNPEFPFDESDFRGWIDDLISVGGVGPRLRALIQERIVNIDFIAPKPDTRPPTVPPVLKPRNPAHSASEFSAPAESTEASEPGGDAGFDYIQNDEPPAADPRIHR
jgi:hypothetical protein